MFPSRCLRSHIPFQPLRVLSKRASVPAPPPPISTSNLSVKPLESHANNGEHYNKSYKEFTSWLNSGGHAEVFEGCTVVGRVVKVFYKLPELASATTVSRASNLSKQLVEELKPSILRKYSRRLDDISQVLLVDWGHKHLGFAPVPPDQECPDQGSQVLCKLLAFEHVTHTMGHPKFERHNEARLEYISPVSEQKSQSKEELVEESSVVE